MQVYTEGQLLVDFLSEEEPLLVASSAGFVALAAVMAFLLLMFELYIVALSSSLSLNIIGITNRTYEYNNHLNCIYLFYLPATTMRSVLPFGAQGINLK